jgi:hypothetical protein
MAEPEHTAFERLQVAIESLATAVGTIQDRIDSAGQSIQPLQARDFRPGAERELHESIRAVLSTHRDDTQGSMTASARALDDEAAAALARSFMALYNKVAFGDEPWYGV